MQKILNILLYILLLHVSGNVGAQSKDIITDDYINGIRERYQYQVRNGLLGDCIDSLRLYLSLEEHKIKRAFLHREMAAKFLTWNKLDSSLHYFEKAIHGLGNNKAYDKEKFRIKFSIGNIHVKQKELEKGMTYYLEVLKYFEQKKDSGSIAIIYENMGSVLSANGNHKDAERYFLNSLEISKKIESSKSIAISYNHLAKLYINMESQDLERSIENSLLALKHAKKSKDKLLINQIKGNLGGFYTLNDDFLNAKTYLLDAEKGFAKLDYYNEHIYKNLVRVYAYTNQVDSARYYFNKIDFDKLSESEKEHYGNLANAIQDSDKGLAYYKMMDKYKIKYDSLYRAKLNTQAVELEKKYNLLVKDNEIRKINEQYLREKVNAELLKAENLERSIETQRVLHDLEAQSLALQLSSQAEKDALERNEKLTEINNITTANLALQKQIATISVVFLVLLLLLLVGLIYQNRRRKKLNQQLATQKDKIQLLNRELNHRVKNNLAFMTSLIEMQGRRTSSQEAKEVLQESESRLKALALVHGQLFRSESDTEVNLKTYLQEVLLHLKEVFVVDGKPIQFETSMVDRQVNAEDAMRLGLIVNELVTNSVKHAFNDIEEPKIQVNTSLDSTGKLHLQYQDNGPLSQEPQEGQVPQTSLGLKLISLLKLQLGDRYMILSE